MIGVAILNKLCFWLAAPFCINMSVKRHFMPRCFPRINVDYFHLKAMLRKPVLLSLQLVAFHILWLLFGKARRLKYSLLLYRLSAYIM